MKLNYLILLFCLSFPIYSYSQNIPDIEGVQVIEELPKKYAPDFEMTMADGSIKKLSDFKGKVVYLSFWASWCTPCINGFNNYRELRDEMESIGVVLLNVSIDRSHEKWKNAIAAHNPTGIHAIVPESAVQESYQMYSVPLYEIVGKEGQFLYLSDEPNRDIIENFKQFINQ